jgi:hypothetical protein
MGFDVLTRQEAHDKLKTLRMAGPGTGLEEPPPEGMFDVVVSRAAGRFQGTVVACLPVPREGEDLPKVFELAEPLDVPPLPPADHTAN